MTIKALQTSLRLFPFRLLNVYREWANRNVDRRFVGASLPITSGGTWKKSPVLPSYRYEFGAAVVDDKIYVIGGINAPSVYHATKKNEVFDVKTQKWESKTDLPVIIHHPGVTSDNKNVFVIGGNGIRITSYKYAHSYDPVTDKWTRLPDMPTKRCALGLSHLDGKIYAVGGADNKTPLSVFEVFDVEKKTWTRLPDMPTKREHLFAVATDGKIFVLGGYQNDRFHNIDTFESYDVKTGEWSSLPSVPAKISGFSACVYDGSIYTFGGEQGWLISSEVYEFKIKENKWYRRTDMPSARYAGIVAPASDGIHIIGGNLRMMTGQFSDEHDIFVP